MCKKFSLFPVFFFLILCPTFCFAKCPNLKEVVEEKTETNLFVGKGAELERKPKSETVNIVAENKPEIEDVVETADSHEIDVAGKKQAGKIDYYVAITPFAFQGIIYDDNEPDYRDSHKNLSVIGSGFYNLNSLLSFGTIFEINRVEFEGFHAYHGAKLTARGRIKLVEKNRFSAYATIGAGGYSALRDDGQIGLYPLYSTSLDFAYKVKDRFFVQISVNGDLSFQHGSKTFSVEPFVGCLWKV